jgi:hypothetical protein
MPDERKPTGVLSWTDWRRREHNRPIRFTLDIRDFEGTASFVLLAAAANRHLGTSDLVRLLESFGVERSRSYVQRRRWMVDPKKNDPGVKPGADGKDERAREIIRANPRASARHLVRLLAECGIRRGKTWVWENRCG